MTFLRQQKPFHVDKPQQIPKILDFFFKFLYLTKKKIEKYEVSFILVRNGVRRSVWALELFL